MKNIIEMFLYDITQYKIWRVLENNTLRKHFVGCYTV